LPPPLKFRGFLSCRMVLDGCQHNAHMYCDIIELVVVAKNYLMS
jgi:hypothetical protein